MTPAQRLDLVADTLEAAIRGASPMPWTFFEDHGRDYTDEGWSHVGTLDAEGHHNSLTYAPGYEANEHAEHDAALMVMLSCGLSSLVAMLREAASEFQTLARPDFPKPDRDPAEGDFYTEDGTTYLYSAGEWRRLAIGNAYSRALLDMADAILAANPQEPSS